MSVIDEVLEANEIYSRTHELRRLTPRAQHASFAIHACMDYAHQPHIGLMTGNAVIRNAGGIVTDDSLRSLLISHYLLDTEEIMVISHHRCWLVHTSEQGSLRENPRSRTGTSCRQAILLFTCQYRRTFVTNYRSCIPIHGFPKRSRCEDSFWR